MMLQGSKIRFDKRPVGLNGYKVDGGHSNSRWALCSAGRGRRLQGG